ncbi:hypothetical protein F4778DRAFT_586649 [Xylariomycetidae sp. FL2044]|nr:hypothetical protein F4778DRAFT_586649 [Xylariomycetidae sp. FL2044]
MKVTTSSALASLAAVASAAKDATTFAVLRFDGDGFLTEGPIDPIVNPGTTATHYHSIMGGSNFGMTVEGDQLLNSKCTTAKIKNDKSNYWVPQLFYQSPDDGTFEKVSMMYMNVYYFFEETDDDLVPFPVGLKMLSGDVKTRDPPKAGGKNQVYSNMGDIGAIRWTCPRTSYDPPSYPADSDGTTAGIADSADPGAGAGFPFQKCDGVYSPLRQDIHFPSCYNPEAGINDHENNMAWPALDGSKVNCPEGYIHVPHIFYEVYWNTPDFDSKWTADGKSQPYVLSNGDATGYSSHGDFISGWDVDTLQTIMNTCNAGTRGMDTCPDIPGGLNDDMDCKISPIVGKLLALTDTLTALPLDNPVTGWGKGGVTGGSVGSSSSDDSSAVLSSYSASSAAEVASSTAEAAPSTSEEASYPTSINLGNGAKNVDTSESDAAATATVQAAAADSAVTSAPVVESTSEAEAGGDPNVSTVWDIVTVTQTTTIEVMETPGPVRRRAPHSTHGHLNRHRHVRGSFVARR